MSGGEDFDRRRHEWLRLVMADARVNATARVLAYHLIIGFANRETGRCCPSVPALAEAMGMADRTIQRAVGDLEAVGYLVLQRGVGRGRASFFRFKIEGEDIGRKPGKVTPFPARKGDRAVTNTNPEKVTDLTAKGDRTVTALKRTKFEPRGEGEMRSDFRATAAAEKTGPTRFVNAEDAASVTSWNEWLAEHDLPPLSAMPWLRKGYEKPGWWLPSRFAPAFGGAEWALVYIRTGIEAHGRAAEALDAGGRIG